MVTSREILLGIVFFLLSVSPVRPLPVDGLAENRRIREIKILTGGNTYGSS